jgi:hypoxanthine-DNA glycosylase
LLSALWGIDLLGMPYPQRLAEVKRRGLGIWDVYARCRREGSLDSAIEAGVPNDLASLKRRAPKLEAVAHNGGESARAMPVTRTLGVAVIRLPSTSPANASWSFERKLAAWREAFAAHGLIAPSGAPPVRCPGGAASGPAEPDPRRPLDRA